MDNTVKDYRNVERVICNVAESQQFIRQKDKLTLLLDKHSKYLSDEIFEEDLCYVTAAKMPEIPKYKNSKNL